jgi:hypothetical protein
MADAALDRERLAKLLGMLGSDHDGEVAAAGRAANALVKAAGATWFDAVAPAVEAPSSSPPRRAEIESTADAIEFCLCWPDELTAWEWRFLHSVRRRYRLSGKQLDVLVKLVGRCRVAETMATA